MPAPQLYELVKHGARVGVLVTEHRAKTVLGRIHEGTRAEDDRIVAWLRELTRIPWWVHRRGFGDEIELTRRGRVYLRPAITKPKEGE